MVVWRFLFSRSPLLVALLLTGLGLLVVATLVLSLRTATVEQQAAERSISRYDQPTPAADLPQIVILTEAVPSSTSQPPAWVGQVAADLGVRIDIVTLDRSAYLPRRAADGSVLTFAQAAKMISSNARAVVFFGGGDDTGAPTGRLRSGAGDALKAAAAAAPKAGLVIVGPTWPSAEPPADVRALGSTLRQVALAGDARYVSSFSWFPTGSGYLTTEGSLTARGEAALAKRMVSVIRPELG